MCRASCRALTTSLLLLAGTVGCGAVKRVHECQSIVEVVNSGLSELYVEVPDAGTNPAAYTQIADAYDAIGKRLDTLAPGDSALAKAMTSYREVADRAAKQSRSYAEALSGTPKSKKEKADYDARLNRIRLQAKSDLVKEATAVRKLNAVCHP